MENPTYTPAGFIDSEDSTGNILPGDWRNTGNNGRLNAIGRIGGNRYTVKIVKWGFWCKLPLLLLLWHANAIDEN